jgi:hypothetical protein
MSFYLWFSIGFQLSKARYTTKIYLNCYLGINWGHPLQKKVFLAKENTLLCVCRLHTDDKGLVKHLLEMNIRKPGVSEHYRVPNLCHMFY